MESGPTWRRTWLCQCACGVAKFTAQGRPLFRMLCHCTICQAFNRKPYADVTVFLAKDVVLPETGRVDFQTYRPPPAVQRGKCVTCQSPTIELASLPLLPRLVIIPIVAFTDSRFLPAPSLHIFYDSRVADVEDSLPKHSGYARSQIAFGRCLLTAMFRGPRST